MLYKSPIQLQLPFMVHGINNTSTASVISANRNSKNKNRADMSEKNKEDVKKENIKKFADLPGIVDELLDEEIGGTDAEIEAQAWQWTFDVEKWIWKQIRKRNIPIEDQEDVFNLCSIEVFHLMKRYNPKYSKVSWANFGILKAMKEYESTSGVVRLPFHVLEKMANLRKYIANAEICGHEVTAEEMQEVTKMKMTDLVVAQERYSIIRSTDKEGKNIEFSSESMNISSSNPDYQDSEMGTPDKTAEEEDQLNYFYAKLNILSDLEIFVLTLRYGLNPKKLPRRRSFAFDGEYCLDDYEEGTCIRTSEVAAIIGSSREKVRQLEISAIEKVKEEV